jgi:hypothetical protein
MYVPDAPWIREAERRGTDYMYEFLGLTEEEPEDPDDEDDD